MFRVCQVFLLVQFGHVVVCWVGLAGLLALVCVVFCFCRFPVWCPRSGPRYILNRKNAYLVFCINLVLYTDLMI